MRRKKNADETLRNIDETLRNVDETLRNTFININLYFCDVENFIKNTIKKLTSPRNKNTIKNKAKILETNINETQMSWHKTYSRP